MKKKNNLNDLLKFNSIKFIILIILFILVCKGEGSDTSRSRESAIFGFLNNYFTKFEIKPVLRSLPQTVIYNDYVTLEANANNFKNRANSLADNCGGNTSNLTSLQDSWKTVFISLKETEITQLGPSSIYQSLDSWPENYLSNPPNTSGIETYISGSSTIDESSLSGRSSLEQGINAIEYLLFDNGSGQNSLSSICTALTGRRRTYLVEAIKLFHTRTITLRSRWDASVSGNFTTVIQTAGESSNNIYLTEKQALDSLLNQLAKITEAIELKKLGYPLGLSAPSDGTIRVNNTEARYSSYAIEAIRANISGIKKYYLGNGNLGITDITRYYSISLDNRIRSQLDLVTTQANSITELKSSINSERTKVTELFNSIRQLKVMLSTELVAALGSSFVQRPGEGDGD